MGMRRITISLDDSLVELAESEVALGRAPSVSAWVAAAIRSKAQARAELVAELEQLERQDPTTPSAIATIARTLGLPKGVVNRALKKPRSGRQKRAG